MDYRRLGASGLKVSPLCLGTMMFAARTEEGEAARIVDLAREAGVNFIDTADAYAGGAGEEMVGRLIKADRQSWQAVLSVSSLTITSLTGCRWHMLARLTRSWPQRNSPVDASSRAQPLGPSRPGNQARQNRPERASSNSGEVAVPGLVIQAEAQLLRRLEQLWDLEGTQGPYRA